jgi:hypothetical protein
MTNSPAGDHTSNTRAPMSTDAPKSTCPAARKFAEYLARRMGPMIEHAARRNEQEPTRVDAERQDVSKPIKH